MSSTVDNRVVEMQFDNKHFEQNVATSMGTLEKLKQSLKLDGIGKGLTDITSAAKQVDISPIGRAAETVGLKFSAMYTIADHFLRRLTGSAISTGMRIVSALAIDPVMSGFQEYETKIGSIQTIMSNTASKGTTMADVTRVIDELNTYADKTIYNFAEMTRNIGTFTAAGVGLEESAAAIQGIANLAASSGSTSQQASTAMYQLSQALAAGTVKLMDWNSVVNAGMGGEKFQEALKATARDHGVAVDEMIKKSGSFRESLSDGWITADILNETLNKFTVDGAKNYAQSMIDSGKWTKQQAEALIEEAQAMEDAATKVKTFTQLWDTMKESAQSGWGKTWELIVGDFEQAKSLWTNVSDVLGGIINDSADARNSVLEGALSSPWQKLTKELNAAGVETAEFEKKVTSVAEGRGEDVKALIKEYGSLEKVFQSGALSSDILNEALGKIGTSMVDLSGVTRTLKEGMKGDDVKQVEEALTKLGYSLMGKDGKDYGKDGYLGTVTRDAIKAFQEAEGLEVTGIVDEKTLERLKEATTEGKEFSKTIKELIDNVTDLGGRDVLIESFKNVFVGLKNILIPIKEAFSGEDGIFPAKSVQEKIDGLTKGLNKFRDMTADFVELTAEHSDKIKNTFKGIFAVLDIGWTFIKDLFEGIGKLLTNVSGIGSGMLGLSSSLGEWLSSLRDLVKETDFFGSAVDRIVGFLQNGINKIKEFAGSVKTKIDTGMFEGFLSAISSVWSFIKGIGSKIRESLAGVFSADTILSALDILNSGLFAGVLVWVNQFTKNAGGLLSGLTEAITGEESGFLTSLTGILDGVKGCFESWQQSIQADTIMKIAKAIALLAASLFLIATIDDGKLTQSLLAIAGLFQGLLKSLKVVSTLDLGAMGIAKAVGGMIGIATAVFLLAGALRMIGGLGFEEIVNGLVGIIGLTAVLVKAMEHISNNTTGAVSGVKKMIPMAIAIGILAMTLKGLSSMSWEELSRGMVGLMGIAIVMAKTAEYISNNMGKSVAGVWSMIPMAMALIAVAGVLKIVATMSWDEIIRGLTGVTGALLAMTMTIKAMSNIDGSALKNAGSLFMIAGSMIVLAGTLKILGGMGWDQIGKALAGMAGALAIAVIALKAMSKFADGGTVADAGALLVMAVAIGTLAGAFMLFGAVSWESIAKGLTSLVGAFVILGVAAAILEPFAGTLMTVAGSIAVLGLGLVLVGAGLTAIGVGLGALATATAAGIAAIAASLVGLLVGIITGIADSAVAIGDGLKRILLMCVDVVVSCIPALADGFLKLVVGVMDSLVTYTPVLIEKLGAFLVGVIEGLAEQAPQLITALLDLIASVFSGLIDALGGLNFSTILKSAAGIGAFVGFLALLGAIGPMIPGAMLGILGIAALVAEVGILIAALGAINSIPGVDTLVSKGGDFLQSIGEAIGKFMGGIVGGFGGGILTSFMDTISGMSEEDATKLQTFATVLSEFVSVANNVPASGGLKQAIEGTPDFVSFATGLQAIGTSIASFASSVTEVGEADISKLTSLSTVIDKFVEVAGKIPASGGLTQAINGTPDIISFATGLQSLGTSVASFTGSVTEVSEGDIAKMTSLGTVIDKFVEIAGKIPPSGGLAQALTGAPDVEKFAVELTTLGGSITTVNTSITEVSEGDIAKLTSIGTVIEKFVEVAGKIPPSGGLAQAIAGAPSVKTFADELTTLGGSIVTFSTSVSEVGEADIAKITSIGTATSTLVGVASSLEGYNDSSWFNTNLTEFAGEMVKYAKKIKEFTEITSGMNVANTTVISGLGYAFLNLATSIGDGGAASTSLTTFGYAISSLGTDIYTFYDSLAEVDVTKISSITTAIKNLASIDASSGESLKAFVDSLGNIGTDAVTQFVASLTKGGPLVHNAASDLVLRAIKGITSKKRLFDSTFKGVLTTAVSTIRSFYSQFVSAGGHLATGFALGIISKMAFVIASAVAIAKAAKAAVEATLGIKSPSRVMMKAGGYTTEGFAIGITKGTSSVVNAATKTAEYAKKGFTDALSHVSDLITMGIDDQPTIRPVLDLSDVSAGVNRIGGMLGGSHSMGLVANVNGINSMMNRRQNGTNYDVVSAIKDLGARMGESGNNYSYNINGVSYNDGSDVSDAIRTLVRAAGVERRT